MPHQVASQQANRSIFFKRHTKKLYTVATWRLIANNVVTHNLINSVGRLHQNRSMLRKSTKIAVLSQLLSIDYCHQSRPILAQHLRFCTGIGSPSSAAIARLLLVALVSLLLRPGLWWSALSLLPL